MEVKITELISEHFGIPTSEIAPTIELRKDLNATDLEIADFFQILENAFAVTITKDEAANIQTVGELISYITDHVEETS